MTKDKEVIQNFKCCPMCNKYFTGAIPYFDHMNSKKHKKKQELHDSKIQKIHFKNGYFIPCEPCRKCFNSVLCYEQHLKSEKHFKHCITKCKIQEILLENEENNYTEPTME